MANGRTIPLVTRMECDSSDTHIVQRRLATRKFDNVPGHSSIVILWIYADRAECSSGFKGATNSALIGSYRQVTVSSFSGRNFRHTIGQTEPFTISRSDIPSMSLDKAASRVE